MKKLTLSIMLLMAASASSMAKSVVFTLTNGTKVYYLLGITGKDPVLRFADGKMTVNADTYEFTDIKNFYVSDEDDPTAIENVLADKNISFHGDMVAVNAPGVKQAAVYDINGKTVGADVTKSGDVVTISLATLPAGQYIIKIDGASFKMLKK